GCSKDCRTGSGASRPAAESSERLHEPTERGNNLDAFDPEMQPQTGPSATIRVLILCTHNSARSQMAEALLRSYGNGRFEVHSAGTEATRVNPIAVDVMREVGVDISGA